jgi:hypothetical protein
MSGGAVRSTAMVGLLGLGVGFNLFGTYYILLQSGALPPSMTPAGANAAKDKQGAAAEGTQGGGGVPGELPSWWCSRQRPAGLALVEVW